MRRICTSNDASASATLTSVGDGVGRRTRFFVSGNFSLSGGLRGGVPASDGPPALSVSSLTYPVTGDFGVGVTIGGCCTAGRLCHGNEGGTGGAAAAGTGAGVGAGAARIGAGVGAGAGAGAGAGTGAAAAVLVLVGAEGGVLSADCLLLGVDCCFAAGARAGEASLLFGRALSLSAVVAVVLALVFGLETEEDLFFVGVRFFWMRDGDFFVTLFEGEGC